MKVLVIHTFYKERGGEDSVVHNEVTLLKAEGMTVSLLTFSNTGNTLVKLLQLPFNRRSYLKTKQYIDAFKPDVIHIHNLHFCGSAAVLYAVKNCGVPIVMTLHNYRILCPSASLYHQNDLFLDSLRAAFPWTAVQKGVYQNSRILTFWVSLSTYLHEKLKVWAAVDQFIVLGSHTKALIGQSRLSSLTDRIVVKPNFCDGVPRSDRPKSRTFYLYVGRLTEEKGLRVLLAAFANNGLLLRIVGAGPLEALVQQYCGLYPNITYLGRRTKEEVRDLLDHSIALIFPSLWYETFGMVVIEAFAQSVPVIASALGNIKYLVRNEFNGLTFKVGCDRDLSEKVWFYHALSAVEKAIYERNAQDTHHRYYTPADNALQLQAIYREAINRHSCRP